MSLEAIFWLSATVVFVIVEAVTVGLVSVWFAMGSLAALICALFQGPVWLQLLWFFVVSIITLLMTRPLVRRFLSGSVQATNADRNIGRTGIVTERIDNVRSSGAVKLDGIEWTARSLNDKTVIEMGTIVVVREIQGVKLLVEPREENPLQFK